MGIFLGEIRNRGNVLGEIRNRGNILGEIRNRGNILGEIRNRGNIFRCFEEAYYYLKLKAFSSKWVTLYTVKSARAYQHGSDC